MNTSSIAALIIVAFMCALLAGGAFVGYNYKSATASAAQAKSDLAITQARLSDLQDKQAKAALLDTQYTQDLQNAQQTIAALRDALAAGSQRLRVSAVCSPAKSDASGSQSGSQSGSVGDASGARLTDAAQRDYLTLRERINTATAQINYLQAYIRQQCPYATLTPTGDSKK